MLSVDREGERLGLTVASLVSLSLEPPLVGVAVAHQAAMHELVRGAGAFALSLLAAGQEAVAPSTSPTRRTAHRALARHRMAHGRDRRAARRRGARLDRVPLARPSTRRATTRSSSARSSTWSPAARLSLVYVGRRYGTVVIAAVVFDLDGVLIDSEHVWAEARQRLAEERGGRYTGDA